jgi:uncharacterized membrane protein YccC
VQRLRELVAHGGIAILAVVFALALAAYHLANALAQVAVYVLNQHAGTEEFDILDFEVFGTEIFLDEIVRTALALVLVAAGLVGAWWLTRGSTRRCPECRSDISRDARICRYCTTELEPGS